MHLPSTNIELTRAVRFSVGPGSTPAAQSPGFNSFAGLPSAAGVGAFYEITIACRGRPDPDTGYLLNISLIDELVRQEVIPVVQDAFLKRTATEPAGLISELFTRCRASMGEIIIALTWRLTPYYCLSIHAEDMSHVRMIQQFEFAASHRLHVATLSDAENLAIFGKCNNEHGHGHNYRLEVAVEVEPPSAANGRPSLTLPLLEQIVHETVIQRFDHRNLNVELPEFADRNPSVENIAAVIFGLLSKPISGSGRQLHHVTVWETAKTSCTVARQ